MLSIRKQISNKAIEFISSLYWSPVAPLTYAGKILVWVIGIVDNNTEIPYSAELQDCTVIE